MAKIVKIEKQVFDATLAKLLNAPALPASKIGRGGKKLERILPKPNR